MTAQPEPAFYVITPQVIRGSEDILLDPTYQGQTSFIMKYVPLVAKDGVTPVTADVLREYLFLAISEEDPVTLKIQKSMEDIQKEIADITKVIKRIPKQEIRDHDNKLVSQEEADEEREIMYKMYGQAKYEIELRYKKREQDLRDHENWRRRMGLDVVQSEVDANTETAVWEVRLFGTEDASAMEDMLIAKDDWQGIKLACGSDDPPLPPWAGRGAVPDGSKPFLPDYTELLVNISGVRILRVPHGVGTHKKLDSQTASIRADRFGVYYGDWSLGKKTGHGIEINDSGVYCGRFVEDRRDGYAQWDLANGTTVKAQMKVEQALPAPIVTAGFENPYYDGLPTGDNVEILFADGGIYRGQMKNGLITGIGVYESAFGETFAGEFKDGIMECEIGKVTTHAGETYIGRWSNGELNGKGAYEDEKGNRYKGYWRDSLKHGRGYETTKGKGLYKGYFLAGLKHGKGELDFVKRKKVRNPVQDVDSKKQEASDTSKSEGEKKISEKKDPRGAISNHKTEHAADQAASQFKYRYQGYFFGDFIANGGIIMDTMIQTPYCVSKRDTTRTDKLKAYKDSLDKSAKRKTRMNEKSNDMEKHIRLEMLKKKNRIFRQQRHYLKKTMYFEDQYGLDPQLLEARQRVRENRLKKVSEDYLKSTRARIPRLQLKDVGSIPTNHLQRAFNNIVPVDADDEQVHAETDAKYKYDAGYVDDMLAKIVVSDFEETKERQNMMKYDRIWERAEAAYVERKKKSNAARGL
eukprot:CAMPEP_0185023260 /NCGR_PEP_ID=MMETSP1103-20130426/5945_1 /TAXON_ID=36769 /ORGANISM="Paraphysomonas bandaiensis, Strain Caron Lab Isolate" /LENGTH=750 /DNA_ID=CAMNT_0027555765 /DNA_START=339 /DNA_END=2591 /DNA_ORIENTATION=-